MGVGGQCHTPSHFTPRKDPVPVVYEAGLNQGLVWTGARMHARARACTHTHRYIRTINSYKSDNSPVIVRNHQLLSYLTTWSKRNETLFLENVQYCCILAVERTFTELRNKGYHSVLSLQEVVYADLQPSA